MKASLGAASGVFLAVIAAFSLGQAAAAAPKPDGLTIILEHMPADTPKDAIICVSGSFSDWENDPNTYRLTPDGHGRYTITLPSTIRGPIEFKFNLGSYRTPEREADGSKRKPRTFTIPETGPATYTGSVATWMSPYTPEGWRKAAATDLDAMHDVLRDNAPQMFVERDSADFRRWLEEGYAQAKSLLPKVHDYNSYIYLLWGYSGGFRDGHLGVSGSPEHHGSPGFFMTWDDGAYVVRTVLAGNTHKVPPVGAKLIDCDGRSPEEIARATLDRYDGNLDLYADRVIAANLMLMDLANPYVELPKSCRFQDASGIVEYPMIYRLSHKSDYIEWGKGGYPKARFGLAHSDAAPKVWRIGIPSMDSKLDWPALYADIDAHIAEIRSADRLIIDLRGNGGGNSGFADELANHLWGEDVAKYYETTWGPLVYPATPVSRQALANDVLPSRRKQYEDGKLPKEEVTDAEELLAKLNQAAAEGRKFVILNDHAPPPRGPRPADPMKAQVFLVTDHACFSACLDLMDHFTAIPNVYQVGTETGADTIFMDLDVYKLPSAVQEGLRYGKKAWIKRKRGSNVSYKPAPDLTYHGDPADEAAFEEWLASLPAQAKK